MRQRIASTSSPSARKVLHLAQEEAQRLNHNYIGTEHLLLGLIREGEGVAAKVLTNLGAGLEDERSKVEFIIGRGDQTVAGDIGLTPRAKKVIELSMDEARRLKHHFVGTEHLLLGLVRERRGYRGGSAGVAGNEPGQDSSAGAPRAPKRRRR
jgi:ATP-dependent Clp protease ATP-binding subunit ClpC